MEAKVNYTIVGLFVTILSIAFGASAIWLSENFDKKDYGKYIVFMNEAVSGLSVQSPVKYNGVDVGYVLDIDLTPSDPQQVRLILNIEEGTPITTSTNASLKSQGITGLTYIGLQATTPDAPPLKSTPGYPHPVIPSKPSLLVQLDAAIRTVSADFKKFSESFQKTLNEKNRDAIETTLQNIEKITNTIAANSQHIDSSLKNVDTLIANTSRASAQLPGIMRQIDSTLGQIQSTAASINEATKTVNSTMIDGRMTLQALNQQTLPNVVEATGRLSSVLTNVQLLTVELQQNPAMIIRGKLPAPPGPGEK